jgi:benzoylformate decarboxylase
MNNNGVKTGNSTVIEQLLADGMNYMFGAPGTSEEGFLDALRDYPEMKYILTLQESIAVLMADGYARATQKPTLVQIHSTPGLGNAIGALFQAKKGQSPLVVIGGDSGVKYQAMDAQMAGDLVAMAEPVTKWSVMVTDPSSLLRILRKAVKIAATPPMGPVYVCLPMDMLDAPAIESVRPTFLPSHEVSPPIELLEKTAKALASAKTPMIFIGDGVAFGNAQEELAKVAELVGAEVWTADSGEVSLRYCHPLYKGSTGHMFGASSLPITQKGDVNLICGTYMLPEVFPHLGDIFDPNSQVIHFDLVADHIGKNHRVDLGAIGHPKLTLAKIATILQEIMTSEEVAAAKERVLEIGSLKEKTLSQEMEADKKVRDEVPIHFSRFAEELAAQLPVDAIIFDEALTNSPALARYIKATKPGTNFLTRGGSLGVGIPGAIGVKLANPDKVVVGVVGDGGGMFTIQGLWSAARHNVNAKFVICNNRSYKLLQLNVDQYWKDTGIPAHDYPLCFDLSKPEIQFDQLARGLGVEAVRVTKLEEIAPAITKALAHNGPFLIDLVIESNVRPDLVGKRCGQ